MLTDWLADWLNEERLEHAQVYIVFDKIFVWGTPNLLAYYATEILTAIKVFQN